MKAIPVFGQHLSKTYLWNLQPSPAYIGQGIIMGLPTVSYMVFGCVLGWAVLAPLARHKNGLIPRQISTIGKMAYKAGFYGLLLL